MLQLQRGTRYHLALPETSSFLDADLRREPSEDIEKARSSQTTKVK
jgi:hypothetical protein